MSKLEFLMRPLIAFDASKAEHRGYYYEFLERGSWGWCPYRFIVPDVANTNLISEIQQKLLQYYVGKEFKTGGRSRAKTVAQKAKKTVDKKAV